MLAIDMAKSSPNSEDVLPRVQRFWLRSDLAAARKVLAPDDLPHDPAGRFLLLESPRARADFLRQSSRNGKNSIPKSLWRRLEQDCIEYKSPPLNSPDHAESQVIFNRTRYETSVPTNWQFKRFLEVYACGAYGYSDIDPHLLEACLVWGDEHPAELESAFREMWKEIEPGGLVMIFDMMRNAVLDRCAMVFAAHPAFLTGTFAEWVKSHLVVSYGGRVVRLNDVVPFLYCAVGAEKVMTRSRRRADEIIEVALKMHTASEDLVASCGRIYATGRGLEVLQPPAEPRDLNQLAAWQVGVIEALTSRILQNLLSLRAKTPIKGNSSD